MTTTKSTRMRLPVPPAAIMAKATTKNLRRYLGHDQGLWVKDRIAADFGEIVRQRRHDLYDRDLDQGRGGKGMVKRTKGPRMYTQAWLATRLGVANSTISAWERGHRLSLLKPGHFWMLGYLLGLTPEEMLEAAGYLPHAAKEKVN
jgi:DNA-binding XRE family transcriptional regulator